MKYSARIYLLVSINLLLTACQSIPGEQARASPEQLCEQANTLIAAHSNGFKQLKGSVVSSPRMDVWDTQYHLVGNDCQIWQWSSGKQTYMCSLTVPDEELARLRYSKAIDFSRQCLGSEWKAEQIERNQGRSYRTIFSKPGQPTVASVHRVKTEGLFKSEWTVYYFIGDRDSSL